MAPGRLQYWPVSGCGEGHRCIFQYKTAGYLPYIMSGLYARGERIGRLPDIEQQRNGLRLFKANVFIIKGNTLLTPATGEGCISGVMRRHLIEAGPQHGYTIQESIIWEEDVFNADEFF